MYNEMKNPLVSVIITTRNEEDNIAVCLSSIAKQSYAYTECIVVDNSSSDHTKEIAKTYTTRVFNRGPERSAQRNYGASVARGVYLLFLDADMELAPDIISECVRAAKGGDGARNKICAVVIPERSVGTGYWTECKILERKFYEGVDWMEAARFYNADIFRALHGFDEGITGPEDFDLSQRLKAVYGKTSVSRIRSYIFHHEGRIVLSQLLRKKWYYGKKMSAYFKKPENTGLTVRQANPISRNALFLRRPGILFTDPIHAIGMIWMKTLELTAIGGGMLSGYL